MGSLDLSRRLSAVLALSLVLLAGIGSPAAAGDDGKALFGSNCAACHQADGKGIAGAFPALAGNALVNGPAEAPAAVILKGRGGMPTFKHDLNDAQIAGILTYMRSAWGNKAPPVTAGVIAAERAKSGDEPAPNPLQMH